MAPIIWPLSLKTNATNQEVFLISLNFSYCHHIIYLLWVLGISEREAADKPYDLVNQGEVTWGHCRAAEVRAPWGMDMSPKHTGVTYIWKSPDRFHLLGPKCLLDTCLCSWACVCTFSLPPPGFPGILVIFCHHCLGRVRTCDKHLYILAMTKVAEIPKGLSINSVSNLFQYGCSSYVPIWLIFICPNMAALPTCGIPRDHSSVWGRAEPVWGKTQQSSSETKPLNLHTDKLPCGQVYC